MYFPFSFYFPRTFPVCRDSVKNKYYALSAASALFKFLETQRERTFQARSLKIRYCPLEGTMLIDSETAKNLELIENVGSSITLYRHTFRLTKLYDSVMVQLLDKKTRHTLYGFLNHCYTPMAARLVGHRAPTQSTNTLAKLAFFVRPVQFTAPKQHPLSFD